MSVKSTILILLLFILGDIVFINWYTDCVTLGGTLQSCAQPILDSKYFSITLHLVAAVLIGAMIGIERSVNGRPAGIRTHILVSMSSCLLMLITVYQLDILPHLTADVVRVDPTRMAQGIMTGIGFLGAGVIMKEGLSIRGLTTAASIWITASLGILVGLGFFFPVFVAVGLTLLTLGGIRQLERGLPSKRYAKLIVKVSNDKLSEEELIRVIKECNVDIRSSVGYDRDHEVTEYDLTICSKNPADYKCLLDKLSQHEMIRKYKVSTIGE